MADTGGKFNQTEEGEITNNIYIWTMSHTWVVIVILVKGAMENDA